MCRPVPCEICGDKITWEGCGEHIDEVRAVVPPDRWCPGHEATEPAPDDGGSSGRFRSR